MEKNPSNIETDLAQENDKDKNEEAKSSRIEKVRDTMGSRRPCGRI